MRWRRRGTPVLEPFEGMLGEGEFERVQKLSAILRLAKDLMRSRTLELEALTREERRSEKFVPPM